MYNTKLFYKIESLLMRHSNSYSFNRDHETYSFKNKVFQWDLHFCDCGDVDLRFSVLGINLYNLMHGHEKLFGFDL